MATFRLVDEDGNFLGVITDVGAVWGAGDMISFEGRDLKILRPDFFATDRTVPVLVVEVVDAPE